MKKRMPGGRMALFILSFLTGASCVNTTKANNAAVGLTQPDSTGINSEDNRKLFFDTAYICNNRHYAVRLFTFDNWSEDETKNNAVFTISQVTTTGNEVLLQDSLYSFVSEVDFKDFNKDRAKDILVQNSSDTRSNHTYYLYLTDTATGSFKRIKGFETIKCPRYIPEHDLVDNYVVSGINWTSFYRIERDTIKDYGIIVLEGSYPENQDQYEKDYKKAVQSIISRNEYRRK